MQLAESLLFLLKQVPSWRSVCVLYSLYCVLILPDAGEAAKARCGWELVADLEFVCGDRGFYRGQSRYYLHLIFLMFCIWILQKLMFSKMCVLIVWVKAGQTLWCGDSDMEVTCMSLNL